jgi:HAD superfamily hydrolase (TIGR01509 family)
VTDETSTSHLPSPLSTDRLPEAVLWDLDGTLVDTEPAWIAAEQELAEQHGVEWTEADGEQMVGSALPNAAAMLRARGVVGTDDEIIGFLIERVLDTLGHHVPWQPAALGFLTDLRDEGVPCALVTMSYRDMADQIVAGAPEGVFGAIVAGDEVTHGKPHPEPYLRAVEMLGVDVTRCVAFEDSPTGLASAEASGARVVGIQRHVAVAAKAGRSRLLTLEGFGLDELRRVVGGEVIDRIG